MHRGLIVMTDLEGRVRAILATLATMMLVGGCDAAEDVEVLPLPELDRPSAEARLGLPEIAGTWRFAGWEIIDGDSTSLERTFPSFGALEIRTQRLDSIAGAFALAGGPSAVVGDVRRDGRVSLVTYSAAGPGQFIAGEVERDTLWLELTSVLAADEWPQDARAAFVREPVAEPIAWLRGARPGDVPPPMDSVPAMQPAEGLVPGATGAQPAPQPGEPRTLPRQPGQQPAAQPAQPSRPQPTQPSQPAQPRPSQPSPAQPSQPAPQPRPAPAQPEPEPEPEPVRQPEPEPEPDLPPLLGDPVQ